jgi:hypothetical protein
MKFDSMAFDSYGLSDEQFKKIVLEEAEKLADLFLAVQLRAETRGLKFDRYTDKLLWDFFQDVGYRAEDVARVHQKKNDPEAIKEHSYDYGIIPTREEMMEEIKSVDVKIEALVDYMKTFVEQNKNGFLAEDRDSNFPGENTVTKLNEGG